MLYLKVAELLSSGLQTAIEQTRAGKLCLSSAVKQGECRETLNSGIGQGGQRERLSADRWGGLQQARPGRWQRGLGDTCRGSGYQLMPPAVVRKLNALYKASVVSCQGLSLRLQRFFLDKQRLLDRIQSVTAEKLIFSHAVHTVGGRGLQAVLGAAPSPTPRFPSVLASEAACRRDRRGHPARGQACAAGAAAWLQVLLPKESCPEGMFLRSFVCLVKTHTECMF